VVGIFLFSFIDYKEVGISITSIFCQLYPIAKKRALEYLLGGRVFLFLAN
tara:strand:+ start:234 stop:383 length:150 start_codon:yes stop_codon:yes gene_type:complete